MPTALATAFMAARLTKPNSRWAMCRAGRVAASLSGYLATMAWISARAPSEKAVRSDLGRRSPGARGSFEVSGGRGWFIADPWEGPVGGLSSVPAKPRFPRPKSRPGPPSGGVWNVFRKRFSHERKRGAPKPGRPRSSQGFRLLLGFRGLFLDLDGLHGEADVHIVP